MRNAIVALFRQGKDNKPEQLIHFPQYSEAEKFVKDARSAPPFEGRILIYPSSGRSKEYRLKTPPVTRAPGEQPDVTLADWVPNADQPKSAPSPEPEPEPESKTAKKKGTGRK